MTNISSDNVSVELHQLLSHRYKNYSNRNERNYSHPSRPVWQPDRHQVLGDVVRRTQHIYQRRVCGREPFTSRKTERVLHRGDQRPTRSALDLHRPGAGDH